MELRTKIVRYGKEDLYSVEAKEGERMCPLISSRLFETEEAAEIAVSIAKAMYSQIDNREDFKYGKYEMALRVTLKLIDSPDAW